MTIPRPTGRRHIQFEPLRKPRKPQGLNFCCRGFYYSLPTIYFDKVRSLHPLTKKHRALLRSSLIVMAYHRSLQASLILSCLLLGTGHALQNATIAEAFPQLAVAFPQIIASPPESPRLNSSYTLGRQDFGKCCSLAVYESLVQDDQGLRLAIPSYIGNDLEQFRSQQYPCDAVYIGNKSGAPLVTANYQWCSNRCPGWQRSNSKNLNQWVLPVLGFIIPAVIFCLAIPRRRKIGISDKYVAMKPYLSLSKSSLSLKVSPNSSSPRIREG